MRRRERHGEQGHPGRLFSVEMAHHGRRLATPPDRQDHPCGAAHWASVWWIVPAYGKPLQPPSPSEPWNVRTADVVPGRWPCERNSPLVRRPPRGRRRTPGRGSIPRRVAEDRVEHRHPPGSTSSTAMDDGDVQQVAIRGSVQSGQNRQPDRVRRLFHMSRERSVLIFEPDDRLASCARRPPRSSWARLCTAEAIQAAAYTPASARRSHAATSAGGPL